LCLLCGQLSSLCLPCGELRGLSLLGRLLRGLLGGELGCLAGAFLRGFVGSALRSFLGCPLGGLLGVELGCHLCGVFDTAGFFRGARGFSSALRVDFLLRAETFVFNGLFHALPGFFAHLGARRGEVAVLAAVQIRPRIEGRNIFRRLVRVGQRVLSHGLPQRPCFSSEIHFQAACCVVRTFERKVKAHPDGGYSHR
jgi:hypothetical protein